MRIEKIGETIDNRLLIEQGDIDRLYRQNYPLLINLIKKYNYTDVDDFDELVSMANVAFCNACQKYEPSKSEFSTFLGLHIKNVFYKYNRTKNASKRTAKQAILSLETPYKIDNSLNETTLKDMVKDESVRIERDVTEEDYVKNFLAYVEKQHRGALCVKVIQYRMDNLVQTEIAKKTNISQAEVSRLLKRCQKYFEMYQAIEKNSKRGKKMNEKTKKVKDMLLSGENDKHVIADKLAIPLGTVDAYVSFAHKAIEKENKESISGQVVASSKLEPELLKAKQAPTLPTTRRTEKKSNNIHKSYSRLKIRSVESAFYIYEVKEETVLITDKNTNIEFFIPKENIKELIEDLKEIITGF